MKYNAILVVVHYLLCSNSPPFHVGRVPDVDKSNLYISVVVTDVSMAGFPAYLKFFHLFCALLIQNFNGKLFHFAESDALQPFDDRRDDAV